MYKKRRDENWNGNVSIIQEMQIKTIMKCKCVSIKLVKNWKSDDNVSIL